MSRKVNYPFLALILALSVLSLFLVSCCKECFLSRAELAWTKTTQKNGIYTTEIHDGDKYLEITSENGGTLKNFTLDEKGVLLPQGDDVIIKELNSGTILKATKQEYYKSNDKNSVSIASLLDSDLQFAKLYQVNLESGDLFVSSKIKIKRKSPEKKSAISLIQTRSVKPGGYLVIPLSMISRYPLGVIAYDQSGKIQQNQPSLRTSKIIEQKLIYPTKGENITLRTDGTDGWFGYILEDKMLIIKYHPQKYKKKELPLVFNAKITQSKIDFSYGEVLKEVANGSPLETSERVIFIGLDFKVNSVADVETVINCIKIPLILTR